METYFNNGEKYLFKVVIDKDDNLVLRARKIRGDIPISKRIIEKLINELVNNPNFELNNYEHRQLQEILDDVNKSRHNNHVLSEENEIWLMVRNKSGGLGRCTSYDV